MQAACENKSEKPTVNLGVVATFSLTSEGKTKESSRTSPNPSGCAETKHLEDHWEPLTAFQCLSHILHEMLSQPFRGLCPAAGQDEQQAIEGKCSHAVPHSM